jgi:hypothetical protein
MGVVAQRPPDVVKHGEFVVARLVDCDAGLALLRVLARSGSVEERALARVSIDELLDRRLELTAA